MYHAPKQLLISHNKLPYLVNEEKPDCNYFLNECSELCNYNILIAQCWGDPLYAYCKATDGEVFHIHGFFCEHSSCPPDAIDLGCEDGWIHEKDLSDLEPLFL